VNYHPAFQTYQFKVIFNSHGDDWKDLSFEHEQILIQEMKDSTTKPMLDNTSTSTYLQEDIAKIPPCPKRSSQKKKSTEFVL